MYPSMQQFLFGVEMECLTVVQGFRDERDRAISQFFDALAHQAPSLPAYRGQFNAYGRAYFDVGHIELACSECASPYVLPSIIERQQAVAARAATVIGGEDDRILLANNNHSGLLNRDCSVWGTHENYLVEKPPETLGVRLLPFLATRFFAGAGGIVYPNGEFVAGVRPLRMDLATGGGTTDARAIHSTASRPHHTDVGRRLYRYHLISGDGHRSQFNWALQAGATALAVKAVIYDAKTRADVKRIATTPIEEYVPLLHRLNVLARPGESLRVDPQIVSTQRIYLDGARRYAARLETPPEWIAPLLEDWQQTLDAVQRMDRPWLAARLDTFAKYELFSAFLDAAQCPWDALPSRPDVFHELALLNQEYHAFTNSDSPFQQLEAAGLLHHRVADLVQPGEESEPYVPRTGSRAEARARFIKENQEQKRFVLDWGHVHDTSTGKFARIGDPFATAFDSWKPDRSVRVPDPPPIHRVGPLLRSALRRYDRGRFREVATCLEMVNHIARDAELSPSDRRTSIRYAAWNDARRGLAGGSSGLNSVHAPDSDSWDAVADFCNVLRFQGLSPDPNRMSPWLERAESLLLRSPDGGSSPATAAIVCEHVAASLVAAGNLDRAESILAAVAGWRHAIHGDVRIRARLASVRAELLRKRERSADGYRMLLAVRNVQRAREFYGQLGNYTLPSLIKSAAHPDDAMSWVEEACTLLRNNGDVVSRLRVELLRCRIAPHAADPANVHDHARQLQRELAGLTTCRTLARVLDHWEQWTGGDALDSDDHFWGV